MPKSPPISSLPYQISTSNDPTKIHKSPIAFKGQDFLSSAANWTKQKLFSNDVTSSPPIHHHTNISPPGSPGSALLNVDINSDGLIVCVYPNSVQIWRDDPRSGILDFVGSTHSINGYVCDAKIIDVSETNQLSLPSRSSSGSRNTSRNGSRSGSRNQSSSSSSNITLVVQVIRSRTTHLEVHQLCFKPSLISTLILPPASSGPGPYQIFTGLSSNYMAVVTSTGFVTLFSLKNYHPLPLSGLEVEMAADGRALLDLQGRWLALTPKGRNRNNSSTSNSNNSNIANSSSNNPNTANYNYNYNSNPNSSSNSSRSRTNSTANRKFEFLPNAHTPINLPPSGPLYERIMENLSSTAVTSLKSISEAGYSGLKYYLSKDSSGDDQVYSTSHQQHQQNSTSSLKLLGKFLFSDQSSTNIVQIIDIPTETSICCFSPLEGLSHISLSPYDATLLTVSTKGDHMYTYDISFVPKEITVTGRYSRGKVPARIKRITWDIRGGFGLITYDRGSLHWFDKKLSFDTSTNKVWKLSNWGIEDFIYVNGGLINKRYGKNTFRRRLGSDGSTGNNANATTTNHNNSNNSHLLLLKQGQLMIADATSGESIWKYDLPTVSIPDPYKIIIKENSNDEETTPGLEEDHSGSSSLSSESVSSDEDNGYILQRESNVDPLSFFELETCLPYPFIHEDRRITISTTEFWDKPDEHEQGDDHDHNHNHDEHHHDHDHNHNHDHNDNDHSDPPSHPIMAVFGLDIPSIHIDFGKAKGEAKFTPLEHEHEHDDADTHQHEQLRRAMESLVLTHPAQQISDSD